MKLVLTHDTALDFTRASRVRTDLHAYPCRLRTLSDSANSFDLISKMEFPSFRRSDQRLHVLVTDQNKLWRSSGHVCHLWTGAIPQNGFLRIADGVYVATPELLFLQMASRLDEIGLTTFAMELAGAYSHLPAGAEGFAITPACTTVDALESFVDQIGSARGAKKSLKALKWAVGGSASPLETRVVLLLCLPVRVGGYGLPAPDMNPSTKLGTRNRRIVHRDELHCDLHWIDKHVALEYDSKKYHADARTRDAKRTNVLVSENEKVYTLTPDMIADALALDSLVAHLTDGLGVRMRKHAFGLTPQRAELRARLFPWAMADA